MSAFIVDKEHIDALVYTALSGASDSEFDYRSHGADRLRWAKNALSRLTGGLYEPRSVSDYANGNDPAEYTPDGLGQLLLDANIASIYARYARDPEGMVPDWAREPYTYERPRRQLTSIEAFSALACYEYQACEPDAWDASEARDFCRALTKWLVQHLPGYDAAPWGVPDDLRRMPV